MQQTLIPSAPPGDCLAAVPTAARTFGYVRVSTREQNEDRQVLAMAEFGVPEKNLIIEKQSGKDFDRPRYLRLLRRLRPGDTLVIKSIDRLGRNYDEILEQWRTLTREREVGIVVLDMPILDTRQGKDLTGALIADIVLQVLSYVAETERSFILQRQREGIAAAQARGAQFGRPRLTRPEGFELLAEDWRAGRISLREAAARLGVSRETFRRWTIDT